VSEQRSDLVSIIIPTFRRPHEVRHAAQSALRQTWRNIEVIVVSDGPHAETRTSVEGLDPRLQYMELPVNRGPASARNAGVEASRGQWITFLDDDDLMLEGKVQCQMALINRDQPHRMVSCRTAYRRGSREDVWPSKPIGAAEDVADYLLLRPSLLGRPGIIPLQTLLLHRSIVEKVPFSNHGDHEDWAWLLEAWHRVGARVTFAWETLVIYNIDTENVSRSRRLNWRDSLVWAEHHRAWIGDRAFCSFLASKAALKAKRARDWRGLWTLAQRVLRNHPAPLDVAFLLGVTLLPNFLLQNAWKRSLRSVISTKPAEAGSIELPRTTLP
jgi:glycosyltransferase involved in cell wall biosynthesis